MDSKPLKKNTVIEFSRFVLENGLRVLVHEDRSTPMAALNVLYNVGSRDESPDKTGFAHLFEHLMFGGSANVPDFDDPIQRAGGENNAFTNSDMTNFYDVMPAQNIETAFWLESDRMLSLNFDSKILRTQRRVVLEEFSETCLDEPYGDVGHLLADMVYKQHPYRWPTIGLVPDHIAKARLKDVKDFFFKYYRPNNAILTVSGNVTLEQVKALCDKWFADIPAGSVPERRLPKEPARAALERRVNRSNKVPGDALYMAFCMPERLHPDFYAIDLLSDILSNGHSSRLYRRLLKERQLFADIDCYVSGTVDPGMFIIEGKPSEGVSLAAAEAAVWDEIELLRTTLVADNELLKVKNKVESNLVFSELSVVNKAINLAFFELLGDAQLINSEVEHYRRVSAQDVQRAAAQMLVHSNCAVLHYEHEPQVETVEEA